MAERGPFLLGPAPMGVDFLIAVLLSWFAVNKLTGCAPRLLLQADAIRADNRLAAVVARHV
ncbi:MAG: hypothetical protein JNN02_06865 [Tabrizicola sp.]|nr:hypothetical protein [Tabrizicola sp.]HMS94832.1 hypothetical protein [Tabrizicola sp.]